MKTAEQIRSYVETRLAAAESDRLRFKTAADALTDHEERGLRRIEDQIDENRRSEYLYAWEHRVLKNMLNFISRD